MLAWRRFVFTALDATIPMGLAYGALLLLAFKTTRGARLLAPLAAAGRMALTTYLTQSVVSTFLQLRPTLVRSRGVHPHVRDHRQLFSIQMAASTW
jgi:uncharacterized membrane protein YeiB